MRLTMSTPPAELPVTLEEAKRHCLVEADDVEDDQLIEGFIAAAVDYLNGPSGILGRAIVTQEWLLELEAWPGRISLPLEPVQSVVVRYLDRDGVEQELPADAWDLDRYPSRRTQLTWARGYPLPALQPVRYPVRISITAGFGGAAEVPMALKVAVQMLVAHWYEHRDAAQMGGVGNDLPAAVNTLLARWRVVL